MTAREAVEKVLAVAKAEAGYLEKKSAAMLDDKTANAGSRNYTKYARDLDAIAGFYNGRKQGTSWCDVFVDWCFVRAFGVETALALLCQPKGSCGAGVLYSARYFQAKGRLMADPEPGDQIFFGAKSGSKITRGTHTGLVTRVAGGRVYTIEGNTSGASGVVANGGGVCAKSYPMGYKSIIGYGRPDWSLAIEETPTPKPEETEDEYMTKDQILNELGDQYIATFDQLPEWAKPEIRVLLDSGIINGGTDYTANPDDINMFLSDIKNIIVTQRMIQAAQ